jgi:hypothetical protein
MRKFEHEMQVAFVEWCRSKDAPPLAMHIFAIPNGGPRRIQTAIALKKEGVVPGVPDLFLPVPAGGFHGLFIEMKTKKGRVSVAQKNMRDMLNRHGYKAIVCRSFESAKAEVEKYLAG